MRFVHLEELAPHMRPAGHLEDSAVSVERVESAIGIGLQDTLEQFQMRLRMFAAPVRRVGKPDGRRCFIAGGAIVPDIGPQATGLRLPFTGCQDRHRRVVGMYLVTGEHMVPKRRDQRTKQRVALTHPAGQCRAFQFNALAGIHAALAIQRQMVTILRHQYMRQQPRSGQSSGERPVRRRGLNDAVTGRTREPGANMPDHTEARGHVFENFGNVLAQCLQGAATVRAAVIRRPVFDRFARQVIGQGLTLGNRRYVGVGFRRRHRGFVAWSLLGAHAFEFFKREFELRDRLVHLLGAAAELHAPEFGNDELEVFDFSLLRAHQGLEQSGVVGQGIGRKHGQSLRDYREGEQPPAPESTPISAVARCVPGDASRSPQAAWKAALRSDGSSLRWPAAR